jgi:hypothetical protein
MKKILTIILVIVGLYLFNYLVNKTTNYDERMNHINHRTCVEVYGLSESCN